MAKKVVNNVPDEETRWFKRGYGSKAEYIGWLQFNDLCDESMGYDDTYHDPYSGRTIRLGAAAVEDIEQYEAKPEVK